MSESVIRMSVKSAEGLPDRIRLWRESKGWTQQDLADSTGLKSSAISHFETGRRKPSFENLYRLCTQLHCPASYLLGTEL